MPKANSKIAIFISLTVTCFILAGCSNPEARKAKQLEEARELHATGQTESALLILQELANTYPNDSDLLRRMAEMHAQTGNPEMAAFFYDQAYSMSPDDVDLLFQTYRSKESAGQPAGDLLETLANLSAESMSPELWIRLGQYRASAGQTQAAVDAYLKGVNPDSGRVEPTDTVAIGQLFLKLDNLPQAKRWFDMATDSTDPSALTALFGNLEIQLRQKQWAEAEATIKRLDVQFPGAVDASQWSSARTELVKWRQAQEKMRAELARKEAAKKAAEEAAKKAAEAVEAIDESGIVVIEDADDQTVASTSGGKAQVIADMEAAESLAYTPAFEMADSDDIDEGEGSITFNPTIAIEPADPEFSFEVTFDQQSNSAPTQYEVTTTSEPPIEASSEFREIEVRPAGLPEGYEVQPARRDLEALLADAEAATINQNYDSAAGFYWEALGQSNTRADIWNRLSQVYLLAGDNQSAETTALEATRLAPDDIAYALDYLRVAQRTKSPRVFLNELETTYARFPRNPELTLSLARAYERIAGNSRDAISLYTRFIQLAPNHPLRPEAENAVSRLR